MRARTLPRPAGLAAALGLSLAGFAVPTPAAAATLPIVERAIAFHGGELYERTRTRLEICSRSGCFELDVRVEAGSFEYRVERPAGGEDRPALRVRVTNDETERWEGGEPVELEGEAVQRSRDFAFARVYFPFLPYRLGDESVIQEDLGLETWDGRSLHKVKVRFRPGTSSSADDEYLYWFDPETGRLEQLAYDFGRGEQAGVRFRKAFNFRRVGGLLFADHVNFGASARELGAPDVSVDVVTPAFVAAEMKEISTIELREIRVEPLAD